ncbi:kinase-like protein [Schizopora paradoxa]|uniref:Kinase-like protein n=1 Tax=Schizopora paradoxa TaxID=27342 RepID=A0A0H2RBR3_9AGAM|nr:kinase-like protein [Schizopora paradoxa]
MSYQELIEDMARAIKCLEGELRSDRVDETTRISDLLNRHKNHDTSEKCRNVYWVGRNACDESPDLETWVTSALESLHEGGNIQCKFDYVQYIRQSNRGYLVEDNAFFRSRQSSIEDNREAASPRTSCKNLLEVADRLYHKRRSLAGLFVNPSQNSSADSYIQTPRPSSLRKDYSEEDLEKFKLEAVASVIDFYLLFHLLESACGSSNLDEFLREDESRLTALINFLDTAADDYRFLSIYDRFEQWRTLLFYTLGKRREIVPSSFFVDDIVPRGDHPIGRGGYADIWLASRSGDESIDEAPSLIALKVLRIFEASSVEEPQQAAFLQALLREAFLWKMTNHTNVAQFIGICQVNDRRIIGNFALASPWMENGNLLTYAKNRDCNEKYHLLAGVANGLIYLHSINIVHGDLKCANVLIGDDGVAKLSDFGLSSAGDGVILVSGYGRTGSGYNRTGTNSAGNPRWLAPELIFPDRFGSLGKATRETDVYAFGMTALELFTGKVPFYGVPDVAIPLEVAINGLKPARPETIVESRRYSGKVWNLMEMCWCHDPSLRPKTLSPDSLFVDFAARSIEHIQINYRLPVLEDYTVGITGWYDGEFFTRGTNEFLGGSLTIGIDEASSDNIISLASESRTAHTCCVRGTGICNYASVRPTLSRRYVCKIVGTVIGVNYDWDWHVSLFLTQCSADVY